MALQQELTKYLNFRDTKYLLYMNVNLFNQSEVLNDDLCKNILHIGGTIHHGRGAKMIDSTLLQISLEEEWL